MGNQKYAFKIYYDSTDSNIVDLNYALCEILYVMWSRIDCIEVCRKILCFPVQPPLNSIDPNTFEEGSVIPSSIDEITQLCRNVLDLYNSKKHIGYFYDARRHGHGMPDSFTWHQLQEKTIYYKDDTTGESAVHCSFVEMAVHLICFLPLQHSCRIATNPSSIPL